MRSNFTCNQTSAHQIPRHTSWNPLDSGATTFRLLTDWICGTWIIMTFYYYIDLASNVAPRLPYIRWPISDNRSSLPCPPLSANVAKDLPALSRIGYRLGTSSRLILALYCAASQVSATVLEQDPQANPPLNSPGSMRNRPGKPIPQANANEDISVVWLFISIIPILLLATVGIVISLLQRWRTKNEEKKNDLLKQMVGWEPPSEEPKILPRKGNTKRDRGHNPNLEKPMIVGYWHPYWYVHSLQIRTRMWFPQV